MKTITTKRVWRDANCPICGSRFLYDNTYEPKTCGQFKCLQQAIKQGLIK